jgi:hypothetical protein
LTCFDKKIKKITENNKNVEKRSYMEFGHGPCRCQKRGNRSSTTYKK